MKNREGNTFVFIFKENFHFAIHQNLLRLYLSQFARFHGKVNK